MLFWNESVWFSTIAAVAVKSTAILAVAASLAFLLRRTSAAVRHLVWTAACAAIVVLPLFSIALPPLHLSPSGALQRNIPAFIFAAVASPAAVFESTGADATPTATRSAGRLWRPDLKTSAIAIWAVGSLAALFHILIACAGIWRMRRSAKPSRYRGECQALAKEIGLARDVEVLETPADTMPLTLGIARPAILLPSNAGEWTNERRRFVLLHELAHVQRADAAAQLMARAALLMLHWWNPLAWYAWRQFLYERERAADDRVLSAGATLSVYASHLLDVARELQAPRMLELASVAMARRSQLEGRLVAILDSNVNRKPAGRAWAVAAIAVAVLLVAPAIALRAQAQQPTAAIPPDAGALITAATSQSNFETLDKAAVIFEGLHQYGTAQRLLETSLTIRGSISGQQSPDYGVGLVNLGDLARKQNRTGDATGYYAKAAAILGERREAAPALIHLGVAAIINREFAQAFDYFEHAQRLDPALGGAAAMWTAVVRQRENNFDEAKQMYEIALAQQDPNSPEAATISRIFAEFLRSQGDASDAQDLDSGTSAAQKIRAADLKLKIAPSAGVYRIGSDGVTPPKVLEKVEPSYTDEARAAKLSGTEVLYVEIGPDGIAHNIHVLQGLGLGLDENGVDAVGQWRFQPAAKDGQPVTVSATIEINWRLM